jgi:hypothetical protein
MRDGKRSDGVPTDIEPISTIPDDPGPQAANDLVEVHVVRAPLLLWERAVRHTDELIREFTLLVIGLRQADSAHVHHVPVRLVELADSLRARYAGISDAQTEELYDALDSGQICRDFTYRVPAGVAEACRQLEDLLDEADAYCAAGELMTLVTPEDQQEFRRWYLGEFVRQVAGEPPTPWPGPLS